MGLLIRRTEKQDFDEIYPLFEQLWPKKSLHRSELQVVVNRGIDSEMDEFFCVVLDDRIIGFCAYAIVNNLWQEGYISFLYAMVINEADRGKGYGKALLHAAVDRSRQQGMKRVELDSSFHREAAHAFYEKFGFEKRAYLFSYEV